MDKQQRLKELCDQWHDEFDVVSEKLSRLLEIRKQIINEKLLDDDAAAQLKALRLKAAERHLFGIWLAAGPILTGEIPNEILFPGGPASAEERERLVHVMMQCGHSPQKLAGLRVRMPDGELLPFWHAWAKLGL